MKEANPDPINNGSRWQRIAAGSARGGTGQLYPASSNERLMRWCRVMNPCAAGRQGQMSLPAGIVPGMGGLLQAAFRMGGLPRRATPAWRYVHGSELPAKGNPPPKRKDGNGRSARKVPILFRLRASSRHPSVIPGRKVASFTSRAGRASRPDNNLHTIPIGAKPK